MHGWIWQFRGVRGRNASKQALFKIYNSRKITLLLKAIVLYEVESVCMEKVAEFNTEY
jgi:hypothetical protein